MQKTSIFIEHLPTVKKHAIDQGQSMKDYINALIWCDIRINGSETIKKEYIGEN